MKYGVCVLPGDVSLDPMELARVAEDAGFESLVFPEHTHVPVRRPPDTRTAGESAYLASTSAAWGQTEDETLRQYARITDAIVNATAAAAATSTLVVGTGVMLPAEHDPIVLAKQIATLNVVAGGRVFIGVGGGWNREEMRDHGVDPRRRWSILRETVLAMRALWTMPEPEFHGEHFRIGPSMFEPRSVQQPHPPILFGGSGEQVRRLALEIGDGWLPVGARLTTDALAGTVRAFQDEAAAAGRSPLPVTIYAGPIVNDDEARMLADVGVERILVPLRPLAGARWADELDALGARVRGTG